MYSTTTSLMKEGGSYLVLQVNGEPLSYQSGYPVQLWTGDAAAWCNEKEVTEITFEEAELPGDDYPDWFFNTGLTDSDGVSNYKPTVGTFHLADGQVFKWNEGETLSFDGFAYSYENPIVAMEYSLDNGATWTRYETDVAAEDWAISVEGDVNAPYTMAVVEMAEDPDIQGVLMGCSCVGNPADGRASVNAQVTGVSVQLLLSKAGGIADGANTVVFTSADGYEVALPLAYVTQRYRPIVFDVNGTALDESMGGTDQLWPGLFFAPPPSNGRRGSSRFLARQARMIESSMVARVNGCPIVHFGQ